MDLLQYLPFVIAFAASVVGVIAVPKWDPTKRGIARLTPIGRLTLAVAGVALLASILLTWRSQQATDFQKQQRDRIQIVAEAELRLAIFQLVWPFLDGEIDLSPLHLFSERMLDAKWRSEELAALDLKEQSPYVPADGPNPPWWEVFQNAANDGASRIDRVLQIYASYLNSEVLAAVSELRTSEFLVMRLQRLKEHVDANDFIERPITFSFVDPRAPEGISDPFGYEEFWRCVRQLDELLARDEARLRRHRL